MTNRPRKEWEYQDDDDDGCREPVYLVEGKDGREVWAEDEPTTDMAYLPATEAYALTKDDSANLRQMPYDQYLLSRHWNTTRRRAMLRAGRQCQRCYTTNRRLDVHHITYERLGREQEADLIVLCAKCHAEEHDIPQ